MQAERVNYLSNFEELINEHGVAIQHVFGDGPDTPGFSYTVGLFEADHAEFIAFGFPPELALTILNDLASCVLDSELTFEGNQRVHQLFRGAPAWVVAGRDPEADYLGTAYSIRDRRQRDRAGTELEVLQLIYQDPAGRWPWEVGSDYVDWPMLGPAPALADATDLTIPRP